MRYSKMVERICTILAILGVIVIFGAVGQDDYMTEIGQVYPLYLTIAKIMLGTAMIVPEGIRAWMTQQ